MFNPAYGPERKLPFLKDRSKMKSSKLKSLTRPLICAALAAAALTATAQAQLATRKTLPAALAADIARTAVETCAQQGYKVSVHVVGDEGQTIVALRGDGTSPHTFENSQRKAYTARTFRVPSGEFAQRVKDNPTTGAVHLAGVVAAQGALPIKAGDEVIGAIGVSGAPGGEKDEACAKAGIDKAADRLK
jgi:uncharacterized protein GlcG (DUF336 family)